MRVRYDHVGKTFAGVDALIDLELDVPDGTFLALLGPSGCGKTTALRILAGLEEPTAGAVFLGDRDVTRLQPKDRDVAMVFQSYALYPHKSVADNIAYPLRVRKVPKPERAERVAEVARMLSIDGLLDRMPRALSGGQRQRVALARAIVREPRVFLMDEPLSNLDAQLRLQMRIEIKRLQKQLGVTTLYVTHDQVEAMTMADMVAVMHEGRLQQLAAPADLYARPANLFVARFCGSPPMNVLEGDVAGGAFTHPTGTIALANGAVRGAREARVPARARDDGRRGRAQLAAGRDLRRRAAGQRDADHRGGRRRAREPARRRRRRARDRRAGGHRARPHPAAPVRSDHRRGPRRRARTRGGARVIPPADPRPLAVRTGPRTRSVA